MKMSFYVQFITGGKLPYEYYWQQSSAQGLDSLFLPAESFTPGLNLINLQVIEQCGDSTTKNTFVINQCPLEFPNIITANDDINDNFVIKNLKDYESVSLLIINRWIAVVYNSENYKNDWNGKDMKGKTLPDGSYFFTATPKSTKYEYSSFQQQLFTFQGFVHIVNQQ
jgi:gliding motility-associated-like protein